MVLIVHKSICYGFLNRDSLFVHDEVNFEAQLEDQMVVAKSDGVELTVREGKLSTYNEFTLHLP